MANIRSPNRIPALDGLRGIAILLVLIRHSFAEFSFVHHPILNSLVWLTRLCWCGVDLFFVLSGFLIGGILLDAQDSPNYFKTFYARRAYRILPLYFLVLTLCFLAFELGNLGVLRGDWAKLFDGKIPWWTFFTFTQNIYMGFGGPLATRGGLSPTWSLAVEEQFYLTLPLLVRLVSRRRAIQLVIACIATAMLLRVLIAVWIPGRMYATYFITPCRADGLGLGVLIAVVVRERRLWLYVREHRRWLYGIAVGMLLILLSIDFSSFQTPSPALYGAEYSIFAVFFGSLLLIGVTGEDWLVKTVFCNSWLMRLGLIAYGTYLLHRATTLVVNLLISSATPSALTFAVSRFIGIGSAILIAQLSWTWFEKPLVRRGHRYCYWDSERSTEFILVQALQDRDLLCTPESALPAESVVFGEKNFEHSRTWTDRSSDTAPHAPQVDGEVGGTQKLV